MRLLISIVLAALSVTLLTASLALYFWVPRFKGRVLGLGTPLPEWQVLLITVSDLTINYFYIVLPAVLAICIGLFRAAFATEDEPSRTES